MERGKELLRALVRPALPAAGDRADLRAWFRGFVLWMTGLTVAAQWGQSAADVNGSALGWAVWIFAVYAFYLSLCCTFMPLPTTWIVLLVASDMVAMRLGIADDRTLRIILAATIGALATGMANLNEYHVFTYLLRFRRVAHVRDTRFYQRAAAWFADNPFWVIVLFSLIPIPVDVIRWLAITYQYPRGRYFAAYFLGRWCRYAIWAMTAIELSLTTGQIVVVQATLVLLVILRLTPKFVRHLRGSAAERVGPVVGKVGAT